MAESLLLDWSEAINSVCSLGRAYAPGAINDDLLARLCAVELDWLDLDERLPSGVYQQYAFASVEPSRDPATAELADLIVAGVSTMASSIEGLTSFRCNEASFHRYRPGDAGLSRHRDRDFYHHLVVGITLSGDGELHLFDDSSGDDPVETWQTNPGDLYLLRAPGFDGCTDGRPAHATGKTSVGRTSLTLRHNSHGFGGGW